MRNRNVIVLLLNPKRPCRHLLLLFFSLSRYNLSLFLICEAYFFVNTKIRSSIFASIFQNQFHFDFESIVSFSYTLSLSIILSGICSILFLNDRNRDWTTAPDNTILECGFTFNPFKLKSFSIFKPISEKSTRASVLQSFLSQCARRKYNIYCHNGDGLCVPVVLWIVSKPIFPLIGVNLMIFFLSIVVRVQCCTH